MAKPPLLNPPLDPSELPSDESTGGTGRPYGRFPILKTPGSCAPIESRSFRWPGCTWQRSHADFQDSPLSMRIFNVCLYIYSNTCVLYIYIYIYIYIWMRVCIYIYV